MTAAQAIAALMRAWDTAMQEARERFPGASEEDLYRIASGAMRQALRLP